MVGCMVATSLAMAPAMLVAQRARVVDLDGPLLLAKDRPDGLRYDGQPGLSAGAGAVGVRPGGRLVYDGCRPQSRTTWEDRHGETAQVFIAGAAPRSCWR